MNIIVYGLGNHLKKNIDCINLSKVVAFCDSDNSKRKNKELYGKPIIMPEEIIEYEFDYIVVSSYLYFFEISSMLIFKYCVDIKKIVLLDYYLSLYGSIEKRKVYENNSRYIAKKSYVNGRMLSQKCYTAEYYNEESVGFKDDEYVLGLIDSSYRNVKEEIHNINGILTRYNNSESLGMFVVSHKVAKEIIVDNYSLLYVGNANRLNNGHFSDILGDNIANLNSIINECTALYWIWKNDNSDYVGLNHYRRFLESPVNHNWMIQKWEVLKILKYSDVIVAERAYFGDKTVAEQLKEAVNEAAFEISLNCIKEIFNERSSQEQEIMDSFLRSNYFFPCQLFVMRRKLLEEYCGWLFPILFEMINRISIDPKWDEYSKRIIGFWAERLLTVWLLINEYSIVELPIIMIDWL